MSYVNIARPSAPLRGFGSAGLGALPRPVQRLRVKNMLPRGRGFRGLGYSISATPPYFTPDPETVVTISPTNGMSPFPVVSTESYLQKNLVGMLQSTDVNLQQFPDAPGATIARYTLAQWIADFTQQAQQRCSMYPGSCGSSTPEQLGQKYGTLGYQVMQMKPTQPGASSPPPPTPTPQVTQPQPAQPQQLSNGPAVGIPVASSPANSPAGSTAPASSPAGQLPRNDAGNAAAIVAFNAPAFLTNPVSIFGFDVPMWILLAGAGVGVYALASSDGGGRRR